MRTRQTMTISLPPAMAEEVERARKIEQRTRSEFIRQALRVYLPRQFPEVLASAEEIRAIEQGRRAIEHGDYITLEEFIHEMDRHPRGTRKKKS